MRGMSFINAYDETKTTVTIVWYIKKPDGRVYSSGPHESVEGIDNERYARACCEKHLKDNPDDIVEYQIRTTTEAKTVTEQVVHGVYP